MLSHTLKVVAKYRGGISYKFRKYSDRTVNSRDMDVTNKPPESIPCARIDYVDDDLTERQRLIKSILNACLSDPGLDGMRSKNSLKLLKQAVCWCTLMVMDIKQLRHLNERLRSNDQESYYLDLIKCLEAAGELVYWCKLLFSKSHERILTYLQLGEIRPSRGTKAAVFLATKLRKIRFRTF